MPVDARRAGCGGVLIDDEEPHEGPIGSAEHVLQPNPACRCEDAARHVVPNPPMLRISHLMHTNRTEGPES